MNLSERTRTDFWYVPNKSESGLDWTKKLFAEMNNGRNPECTLPQSIEVVLPDPIFGYQLLSLKLIDTKGIDGSPQRADLESHFYAPETLVVFCTSFNDAPDLASQELIRRAKASGVRNVESKTLLLVLAQDGQALSVKGDDGSYAESEQEGYEQKESQIVYALENQGISGLPVLFLNSKSGQPEPIRQALVQRIVDLRQQYCRQLEDMNRAVAELILNYDDISTRSVFGQANRQISTWIDHNRELKWPEVPIQGQLISAILSAYHPSILRWTVDSRGETNYGPIDYYHHLSNGIRGQAVNTIGVRIDQLKIIIYDPEMVPAKNWLVCVTKNLDSQLDQIYREIQDLGRDFTVAAIKDDVGFWQKNTSRWGAPRKRPRRYKDEIRDLINEHIQAGCPQLHKAVQTAILEAWRRLLSLLNVMLVEKGAEVGIGF